MESVQNYILKCKNNVINGNGVTKDEASILFNLDNQFMDKLINAANSITRNFHGSKVDIEELANIKKKFL